MVQNFTTLYMMVMSIIGFFQMMVDKRRAKRHSWRISESALLFTAALGGALGSFIGMYLFRHKTKHPRFYIGIPLFLLIQAVCYYVFFYYLR